jgi:hypothetical protein
MRGFFRFFFLTMCGVLVLASVVGATAVLLKYGVEAESGGCESRGGCQEWPFDSREWGTYGNLSTPVRAWMVDDLLNNVGVAGQTKAWVDTHLGTPDRNEKLATRCSYVYWLGPVQALVTTQSEWLCLNFEADVVTAAVVIRQ